MGRQPRTTRTQRAQRELEAQKQREAEMERRRQMAEEEEEALRSMFDGGDEDEVPCEPRVRSHCAARAR